ncbi:hypothetical protein MTO96_032730 [Rhipicephalus appendiculatus]
MKPGGQGDEDGSLLPKISCISYWEARVIDDKTLENFSSWLIIVGHVSDAPHGIVPRSKVGDDIGSAAAEVRNQLGMSPHAGIHEGTDCEDAEVGLGVTVTLLMTLLSPVGAALKTTVVRGDVAMCGAPRGSGPKGVVENRAALPPNAQRRPAPKCLDSIAV